MKNIFIYLILSAGFACASPLPDYPFVYASGTASREVAPEKAGIYFEIKSFHKDPEAGYALQANLSSSVIAFANTLGIDENDIVAEPIQKDSVTEGDRHSRDNPIIGYEFTRDVRVEIKRLEVYTQFIDFLYKQQAIESIHSNFDVRDQEEILDALLQEACKHASKKAAGLATGFSRKIKSVRAVSESGFHDLQRPFGLPAQSDLHSSLESAGSGGYARDFRTIPLTIRFERQVYAIYEID